MKVFHGWFFFFAGNPVNFMSLYFQICLFSQIRTAKTQYRKFEANIPRKGIARPQSQFHIHVLVSDYIFPRSVCLDWSWEYIYKLLTDTWMWQLGLRPRNSCLEIHKWDFRCSVEARLPMSGIEASRLVLISYSLSSWHTSYPFWNLNLRHYDVTVVQISFSWIHGHARKRSVVELQNKVVVFRN